MILTQLPEQNLKDYGEYAFLHYQGKSFSNRSILDAANCLAAALRAQGVQAGDRVLVCMPNRPEVFYSYQGVMRAGGIVIPVMFLLHPSEIAYIVSDSEARAIITSAAVLPSVLKAIEPLENKPTVLVADAGDEAGEGVLDLRRTLEASEPIAAPPPAEPDDVAVILYTSGTTGRPKGVMLTHKNLYSNAAAAVSLADDEDGRETTIGVLPLAHIYGFTMANVLYMRGSSVVVMPKYDVHAVCRAIQDFRVRRFSAVPAMIHNLVTDPAPLEYDTSSLESVGSGSAPLPLTVIEAFKQRFGADIYEGYGLSEAAPTVSAHRRGEPIKPGSVGRPFPGVEVRIADDDGKPLPVGEAGELLVRGDNISPGYFRNEEATREAIRDGWLHTGDIAKLDADGYLYIVDRKKDLIIRGGFNIYPRDLEEVIARHPAVAEVAVVGTPSERMGEEVVAFVVKKAELGEAELIAYCQEQLAKYKTPRTVVFVDNLPRSGVGKILKKDLRLQARDLGDTD